MHFDLKFECNVLQNVYESVKKLLNEQKALIMYYTLTFVEIFFVKSTIVYI